MWSRLMPTLLRSAVVVVAIAVGSVGARPFACLPWALLILMLDLGAGGLVGFGLSQSMTRCNQALIVTLLGAAAYRSLDEGARVSFVVKKGPKGLQAEDVSLA